MMNGASGQTSAGELEFLLSSLRDVVWIASIDGDRPVFVSDACERVYGRGAREFQDNRRLWIEVVHPEDRAIAETSARHLDEHGEADVEYRILQPCGEIRWIHDHKASTRDPATGKSFLWGVARDITERKRSERLAQIQHDILEAVAVREDLTVILESICREVEEFVPDSTATVMLLDHEQLLRVAAAPTCSPDLVAMLDGMEPGRNAGSCGTAAYTAEPCIVSDTATDERWESFRDTAKRFGIGACWSVPVLSRGTCVLGTFAVSSRTSRSPTDFQTELLETATRLASISVQNDRDRNALRESKESAESAARTKSELLANVSHELRTPMTAILGFSEMLLQDKTVPERQRRDIRLIKRSGNHLLDIINNLLDVSKIEAGHMEAERVLCSPRELITSTTVLFDGMLRDKQLELRTVATESLPPRVLTDATRLRQILLNLLSNAVKFTDAGKITIRCASTTLDARQIRLEIAVSDTGLGVEPDRAELIFAPFGQAHCSSGRFGGTGLGLSVSRKLAHLLGGDITLESEPGRGSTFTLSVLSELPDQDHPEEDETRAEAALGQLVSTLPPSRRLSCRVLVVEDTLTIQRLVQAALERAGADVLVAEDGRAGCQAFRIAEAERPFDLVLMDMHMPVMDGYAAVRALRRHGFEGPIVALTARAQPEDRDRCLDAGCDAYMSKPIETEELVNLVAELTHQVPA